MQNFDELTLQQLTRPEGYDCACGHHHACALQYLRIGRGALTSVPDMLSALGSKRPFVLCDRNTYAAAGERVCALLSDAGVAHTLYVLPGEERISPAEWEVGSAVMHYDPRCDLILAVGSGVLRAASSAAMRSVRAFTSRWASSRAEMAASSALRTSESAASFSEISPSRRAMVCRRESPSSSSRSEM